jgi:segregation and condensation protein B
LIEEAGRDEGPGRPLLYGTTPQFLERLGLPSLAALPSLAPLLNAGPGDLNDAAELAVRDEGMSDEDDNVEPPARPGND